ncbi:MAG: right-handed parallel beta-helix repeat-containing protein [Proteiniphilum sp.]
MKYKIVFLLILLSFVVPNLKADQIIINITDYGVRPNSHSNIEPIIRKVLLDNINADSLIIHFARGRYDFWPAYNNDNPSVSTIGFDLTGRKNITIDGRGSEFIFHGKMMCFLMKESRNILLKNFSIDWDRPFISQGMVTGHTDEYIDIEIDPATYPYEIRNDSIYFFGEGWSSKITPNYNTIYDKETKDIVYQTRDNPLGEIYDARVSKEDANIVRFHFKPNIKADIGTYVSLYHGAYITDGILVLSSKNTYLENINIYHTLSCGVSGYKSENIYLKNVNIITNNKKNRIFSTVADATHFNGCKGEIVIDNCEFSGAGDDCTNVHGMYSQVIELADENSVIVAPNGRYIGFEQGEKAWIVDTTVMQRKEILQVTQQKKLFSDGKLSGYQIFFSQRIYDKIEVGNLLENVDRNPNLTIKNCKFLKKNRARGILTTTAGKVLIENNYFNSAGAAILIEGDIDLWFESGAVRDVVIRDNIFEDCYTSGNNIVDKPWGWGEAPVTITPSVQPKSINSPTYHRHIRIERNHFKHYDYPLLYARSVDSLYFTNNTIEKTTTYVPFYRNINIFLDGCRNVFIRENKFDTNFPGKNIFIRNMRKEEIVQNDDLFLSSEE